MVRLFLLASFFGLPQISIPLKTSGPPLALSLVGRRWSDQSLLEFARRLAEEGIVPRKDADQALAELAQAQVNVVTARRNLELATLRAPIAGVVTRLGAVLGQPVDPSQPIVDIADPAALDVVLELPPAQAAEVHRGDSVVVIAGASAGGEPLGAAVVHAVAATVDTATRSVAVRARLAHPRRTLRIGETVFGRIVVAVHPNAVAVPVQALVPDGERFKVFVVDSAGIAHARVITVGARTEQEAEITHGLAPGDVVITGSFSRAEVSGPGAWTASFEGVGDVSVAFG